MAKFVYRMQNILDIKLKLEDQAKIAYGIANRRLAEEQEKLQTILIRRTGFERHAKELMNGPLDMGKIKECRRAIDVLKSMQRTQMMNVHAAERALDYARRELDRIMIERKTQEKLRERAFTEFKQELSREEGKEIDELVSYQYHVS